MNLCESISAIIPLYNKERTVGAALESILGQRVRPFETVVVDDGSTDGGAAVVEALAAQHPEAGIRLVRQPNAGVSAARNRAIAGARGEYVALLDADDLWTPDHIAGAVRMIEKYPDCVIWSSSFRIDDGHRLSDGDTPDSEGVVDFFAESLEHYAVIPSAAVLRRRTVLECGGFPEGMRMGEDQYLWVKMARCGAVCCSPARTAVYSKTADNRSSSIYRREECPYSFEELLEGAASDAEREYIARAALGKALVQSAKGGTGDAARAAAVFGYTRLNRRALRKLKVLNSLPVSWRQPILDAYNHLAWILARKGL